MATNIIQCKTWAREDTGRYFYNTVKKILTWGLVPSFTKSTAKADHFLMFNARSESVQERPAFKRLLDSKRCVVLCEGYYEWHQVDKREKQPYYFYREGSLMKFAGLYDHWKNDKGEVMCTYTILTTAVAPEIKWLHTRMPVILSDENVERWLSGAKFEDLKDILASYCSSDLRWHPVDKRVGSMQFQGEECTKKIDIKRAGDIKTFFGVKPEKQEPLSFSPTAPTKEVKTENEAISDTATSALVTKEESGDLPKKKFEQFPAKFVPASSIVDKRSDEETQKLNPPKELQRKRRRVSLSPTKPSKVKLGPKQSSLDFFFGKSPQK